MKAEDTNVYHKAGIRQMGPISTSYKMTEKEEYSPDVSTGSKSQYRNIWEMVKSMQ